MDGQTNGTEPAGSTDSTAAFGLDGTSDFTVNGMAMANGDGTALLTALSSTADEISKDEMALYDRQIRLWGVQAQENIRKANILLISAKALANEIAKNLVLAGIGSLTVIDPEVVTEQDVGAQFLVSHADVGKNRAEAVLPQLRKLNPRVKIAADPSDPRLKEPDYFSLFDLIIATDLDFPTIKLFNAASRLNLRPFYAAGAHGVYGYVFADLIMHDYVIERDKPQKATILGPESATRSIVAFTHKKGDDAKVKEIVTKREIYNPIHMSNTSPLAPEILANRRWRNKVTPLLSCFRALWDFEEANGRYPTHSSVDLRTFTLLAGNKHKELQLRQETLTATILRSFLQNLNSELAPVTAFLGGHLAQDVINVLGKREQPIQNLMVFDGESFAAPVYALHPIFQDDLALAPLNGVGVNGFAVPIIENGEAVAGPSGAPAGVTVE